MRRPPLVLLGVAVLAAACSSTDATATTTTSPRATTTTAHATTTTTEAPEAGPWWNDRVFYEVFVRSFQDSDGNGIGDLQGVIDRLDYLNDGDPATTDDLGVTGIWLMPIMESPSYHGYDVTDYYDVDFEYGHEDDMRRLLDEAHNRGVAVIIDLVLNHTSKSHPWFGASFIGREGFEDYYLWRDDPGPHWHEAGGRYYFGLFWEGMPDLNLENAAVTAELYAISDYWLDDIGVDGFRLDAVKHYVEEGDVLENTPSTYQWAAAFKNHVAATRPEALTVGEVWNDTRITKTYVPDQVDLVFDFSLAEAFIEAVQQGRTGVLPIVQQQVIDSYPPGQYAAFLTNHDQDRIASVFVGDTAKAKLAGTLLMTQPGVPFVYYGEELGARGRKPDERIRTPMAWTTGPGRGFTSGVPWQEFDEHAGDATVATHVRDPNSVFNHYRTLIQLRSDLEALRTGDMTLLATGNDAIYAFTRSAGAETIAVVLNLSNEVQQGVQIAGLGSGTVLIGPPWDPGKAMPAQSTVILDVSS